MANYNAYKSWTSSHPSSTSSRTRIIKTLFIYIMIAYIFCAVAFAQDIYEDKKNDPNNRPFYMGSRYGRSGQTPKVQVVPRNDRFFMGSRYGKRANQISTPETVEDVIQNDLSLDEVPKFSNQGRLDALLTGNEYPKTSLTCAYLGVGNLYRCSHREFNMGPSR